jgi:putative phage-type endonuclease
MITEEQRLERMTYLGASDAAAVLGLSRWQTPLGLWAEKTGQLPPNQNQSLAMEVGNELEELVCKLFTKRANRPVRRVNETQVHPNYSFIRANIDRRIIGEDAILEAKTCSGWKAKEWDGDDIPQEYLIQVQHQLAVTGKERGYIAVLIGGNQDFRWKEVPRDNELIKEIIQREAEFWTKYVEPKVMPMTVTADDAETLEALFPAGNPDSAIVLPNDVNITVDGIRLLQEEVAERQAAIDANKNRLRLLLGDNALGTTDRFRCSWKLQKKAAFTVKASESRVLRISEIKKKEGK